MSGNPGSVLALAVALAACGSAPEVSTTPRVPPEPEPPGGANCLQVAASDLDLGSVQTDGCSKRAWIRIGNGCAAQVRVEDISLEPVAQFEIVGVPAIPASGLVVPPGASTDVWIRFAPQMVGPAESSLKVTVANAAEPTRSWTVRGAGVEPIPVVDEWFDDSRPAADLLMVLDNGPGFEQHLTTFRANMLSIAKYQVASQIEAQVALTTTGGTLDSAPGALVPHAGGGQLFRSQDSSFTNEFRQAIESIGPSGTAMGVFDATLTALSEAGPAGLFRDKVPTAILFVTHRTESSSVVLDDFLAELRQATGEREAEDLVVYAFAGFESACATDDGTFRKIVELTNGRREDICVADWAKGLETLSKGPDFRRTWWFLSQQPDLSRAPIQVSIEDVPVPKLDSRGAPVWTFDPAPPAVVFEPPFMPEPAQRLRVAYLPACGPG